MQACCKESESNVKVSMDSSLETFQMSHAVWYGVEALGIARLLTVEISAAFSELVA